MTAETQAELACYFQTWAKILRTFGWSKAQANAWSKPLLEEHGELTLHEPASQWLAPALVPPELRSRLNAKLLGSLYADVQEALDQGDDFWHPESERDLLGARRRVENVLRKYRSSISAHNRQKAAIRRKRV